MVVVLIMKSGYVRRLFVRVIRFCRMFRICVVCGLSFIRRSVIMRRFR